MRGNPPLLITGMIVGSLLAARCAAAPPKEAADTPTPHPTVTISFERDTVRENDILPIHVYLANDTDAALTDLHLSVALPANLSWADGVEQASGSKLHSSPIMLALPAMAPHTTLAHDLSIQTAGSVQMGDYTLPFVVGYHWQTAALPARSGAAASKQPASLVVTEKTLKARFFGSDSIAGIPLGLAGLIVPGLVFWMVLGWANVPWSKDLALGDRLIYSVLASILILLMFRLLPSLGVSSVISLDVLARLGGVGLLTGAITAFVDHVGRNVANERREARAAELIVSEKDDVYTLLNKMVQASDLEKKLNPGFLPTLLHLSKTAQHPQARVEFKQQAGVEVYLGSVCAISDNTVWLIGWYEVTPPKPDAKQSIRAIHSMIGQLLTQHKLCQAIALARDNQIEIREGDSILQQTDNEQASTDAYVMHWPQDAVTVHEVEDKTLPVLLTLPKPTERGKVP